MGPQNTTTIDLRIVNKQVATICAHIKATHSAVASLPLIVSHSHSQSSKSQYCCEEKPSVSGPIMLLLVLYGTLCLHVVLCAMGNGNMSELSTPPPVQLSEPLVPVPAPNSTASAPEASGRKPTLQEVVHCLADIELQAFDAIVRFFKELTFFHKQVACFFPKISQVSDLHSL